MRVTFRRKAFIALLSIAFLSLIVFIAVAAPVQYFYDEQNRLERVEYPDGTYIRYTYDKLGNITSRQMFWTPQDLIVQKSGTGSGTITSNPTGINCGPACSSQTKQFQQSLQVTLKAMPDDISYFAGWSGGGCSGTGDCVTSVTGTTVVTAAFNPIMYTLTVNRSGGSNVAITSAPAGITNCSPPCTAQFRKNTVVSLTAAPDSCTIFNSWSAAVPVTMSEPKTVTALLRWMNPTSDFIATMQTSTNLIVSAPPAVGLSSNAPFDVAFTDQSTCATAWTWNFGDPDPNNTNISTLPTPTHAYRKPGTYSVTLTASNPDGSSQKAKNNLISAIPCPNFPAKIGATYYQTLSEAISSAQIGATIQFHAIDLPGPVSINKALTLDGGYNCWYTGKTTGITAIQGNVSIENGPFIVTMDGISVN